MAQAAGPAAAVDIVVPVYGDVAGTRACLQSVLQSVAAGHSIYAIDDASPEPGMVPMLQDLTAAHPALRVLRNDRNLGFVRTANRGFGLDATRDVILLNSDTLVSGNWVERLQRCAYSKRRVATVTPFTNNGTLCSYPKFLTDNSLPAGVTVATLDRLFARANPGASVAIPTAVGFCMYVRRDCLDEIGPFDEESFGRGYGEENDFCLRAAGRGWTNLLCGDAFVYHAGGKSFGDEKHLRAAPAHAALIAKHPQYPRLLSTHFRHDPACALRRRVDLLRLKADTRPLTLLVAHDQGGGVRRHILEVVEVYGNRNCFLLLEPAGDGQVRLRWLEPGEDLTLYFRLPQEWETLCNVLSALAVQRVHFHHLLNLPRVVKDLPAALGVPYDFTLHDYFTICPRVHLVNPQGEYCGEPPSGCRRCPPQLFGGGIASWRRQHLDILQRADRVFTPSVDAATRLNRYAPHLRVIIAPLPDPHFAPRDPDPAPLSHDSALRILVMGALSPAKGSELLEACARDAQDRQLMLEFRLLGYASRRLATRPRAKLDVHGPYNEHELQDLIRDAGAHLIWFPARCPETFSYTLSAALTAGLPVVVPDLGAFPERVAGRPWSWVRPWKGTPTSWNDFFCDIRSRHFLAAVPPVATARSTSLLRTPDDYIVIEPKRPPSADLDPLLERVYEIAYPWRSGIGHAVAELRARLYDFAFDLRRSRALAWMAKHIPISFQRRIARLIIGRQR